MTARADRNAAIWYAEDGYQPMAKGINGRRVAGASFLDGFLRHGDVDEFVALVSGKADTDAMVARHALLRPDRRLRLVQRTQPLRAAPVGTLFYSAPNYFTESWQRAIYGPGAYSICGMTHTTASAAVMQGLFDLRMSPQMEWDAIICTSQAVKASVEAQFDMIDAHLAQRFRGAPPPARPQLPVIPLGVDCAAMAPDPEARRALRARIGAGEGDVVLGTIARLNPNVKFDPIPFYLAVRRAQAELGDSQRLFIVFCGVFTEDHGRRVFGQGGDLILGPGVVTLLDGASAEDRRATLSAADVFVFPVDNIQETFGLAPIEGMAAGLPLLVSDWDGMKDTVSPDVGFRVTSRTLTADFLGREAWRHHMGIDPYGLYCGRVAAMVEIDFDEMVGRIVTLARDPALRRRMGAAGARRARELYDWAAVIPQMQDLWGELGAIRRRAGSTAPHYRVESLPVAPSPMALFASYPTEQVRLEEERFRLTEGAQVANLDLIVKARDLGALRSPFQTRDEIARVMAALAVADAGGLGTAELAAASQLPRPEVARVVIWLLKNGMAARV